MAGNLLKVATMKLRAFRKHCRAWSAFTLVEGLVAVAIVGTVFVALYTAMASGFRTIGDSQENLRATQILLEKFEAIRLYNWEQVTTPGFIPPAFTEYFAPNENNRGITYEGRVTIGPPPATEVYNTDLRAVRVDLTWVSSGVRRNRTFTSFVAKYGIQHYIF